METTVKNFQNELVAHVISASCYNELKSAIQVILLKVREQGLSDAQTNILINEILHELKYLNQGRLPYEQHANIISAKNILKRLNTDNRGSGEHL